MPGLTSTLKTLAAVAAFTGLAGCTAMSPYSHLTKLDLKLSASDQLNPDLNGRPSPMVVRLFELKNAAAFESAQFFSLYENAKEVLAPDLVAMEELELRPGETVELKLKVKEDSRYIGVLGAYRDLREANWRYTLPVTALGVTQADLVLDHAGIGAASGSVAKAGD